MAKKKKKLNLKDKIVQILSIVIIASVFLSVAVYNITSLFEPKGLISSEGEIIKKEKVAYQDVKSPEFNHYFTIIDINGKTQKYKVSQILFDLYDETQRINFKYKKMNNEIYSIEK